MVHLFDPENRFWAFVGKLADVFCLSLLWLLTSLPVVTAGAATAAFYHFSIHQVNDTESTVWHGFFAAFRRFFKKATLLWLMEAAGFAFLGCDLWLAWRYFESVGGGCRYPCRYRLCDDIVQHQHAVCMADSGNF